MQKGQIVGGTFDRLCIRQKSTQPFQIGELLIVESAAQNEQKMLVQVYDLTFGSQISSQNLELISGMQLEYEQPVTLFESELRNYTIALAKIVLTIDTKAAKVQTSPPKALPSFFTLVRTVEKSDMDFLSTQGLYIGDLRSGTQVMDISIAINTKQVLSHHVLIGATTGKGKSNLLKHILYELLDDAQAALLVFDPHDEYIGRQSAGLKDHPNWSKNGLYFSQKSFPGATTLRISYEQIHPKHLQPFNFSQAQEELLYAYFSQYKQGWIQAIFDDKKLDFVQFHEATPQVVKRRLQRLLQDDIFTQESSTLLSIVRALKEKKTVIVDTSTLSGKQELLVTTIITQQVFDMCKSADPSHHTISIVLEEALRVLGKDILERGSNIFSTIAKEGRKFSIGLCAITQLPSQIPKDILANMNTKIILGIEMAPERNAIIESAAQDLREDSRAIASLDKGEAIITSNFTRFAIPVKIPFFEKKRQSTKVHLEGI
ncbi:MAG: ATP-binding protein [Candidatus Woesearchaeota archaeon]